MGGWAGTQQLLDKICGILDKQHTDGAAVAELTRITKPQPIRAHGSKFILYKVVYIRLFICN